MMRAAAALLMLAAASIPAAAQVGCLPPEAPFAYALPKNDPELRALIDEEYQDYIRGTEAYLNCLNAESMRARETSIRMSFSDTSSSSASRPA